MPAIEKRKARRLAALERAESSVPITFAIVGVQKAATTSLYEMLVLHPQVVDGPQKEIRFFLESRDWARPDYSTYRRPVLRGGEVAGDATPAYLFWPGAMEHLHAYNPGLRLMASFRDPIERAFSHWAMERMRYEAAYPDLPEAIELYGEDALPDEAPTGAPTWLLRRSLFSRGLYGAQLERALALFPPAQWELFEFRDIVSHYEASLDRATDLLGLERFATYPALDHRMATPTTNSGTSPGVAAIERLVRRYEDDLAVFERLSGVATDTWPTRQVIDGRLEVAELHARLCAKLGLQG
ncbi:MAG: hypothetical protein QOH37_1700 [Nocardioidaceae bacterium]|nr:hypothetical protein [Nocardioidaceae bacterium]